MYFKHKHILYALVMIYIKKQFNIPIVIQIKYLIYPLFLFGVLVWWTARLSKSRRLLGVAIVSRQEITQKKWWI